MFVSDWNNARGRYGVMWKSGSGPNERVQDLLIQVDPRHIMVGNARYRFHPVDISRGGPMMSQSREYERLVPFVRSQGVIDMVGGRRIEIDLAESVQGHATFFVAAANTFDVVEYELALHGHLVDRAVGNIVGNLDQVALA